MRNVNVRGRSGEAEKEKSINTQRNQKKLGSGMNESANCRHRE